MGAQLEAQIIVPQELEDVSTASACSFTEALNIVESNEVANKGLALHARLNYEDEDEMRALELLPKAFDLNTAMQKLEFYNFEVDHILVAEALKAGVRNDNMTCVEFWYYKKVCNQRLMETMCEGFRERSTAFQLVLNRCSSDFVKLIIEASCLKCFSLSISTIDVTQIVCPLKKTFMRANLYYVSLRYIKGLEEEIFVQLGRCLLPNLAELDLFGAKVPSSALKRLHGSLNMILNSGRSNLLEYLGLGVSEVDGKLAFAYFRLLRSDLVENFRLRIEEGLSRAVVKHISSTIAKTKNLKHLVTEENFSSGTTFHNFILQEEYDEFMGPFQVNPYCRY